MNFNFFIGIDVSKKTLDICVLHQNRKLLNTSIENTVKQLNVFWRLLLKSHPDFTLERTAFCMEHTGIYNHHLLNFLASKQAKIFLEHPTQIKLSTGLHRGKTDIIDAERIATYAYKQKTELRLWNPARDVVRKLKNFSVLRDRLVNAKKILTTPVKELEYFDSIAGKEIISCCKKTIKQLEKDILNVETKIQQIIDEDENLSRLFKLTTSVSGVGKVIAWEVIITTNEFKSIDEPKKFACYAGVAPFEHSSGTSVRGKTRVSHHANKKVKRLLHMGAISASHNDQELKQFYERKVSSGKNKMLVLNAIRNKLIHRMFACVREDRLYQKNYIFLLHKS